MLFENHEAMLPVRKKRILNEAAGIRTFLLRFGRPFPHIKVFVHERSWKYDLGAALLNGGREGAAVAAFLSHLCDRTICVTEPSPHISQMFGRDARLHTAPMLIWTPALDSVSQAPKSVETSLDAADTSVRATSVGGL
jgi:hypothetical protein